MSDRQHDKAMLVLAIFGTIIATALTVGLTTVGVIITLHWWSN